VPFLRPRCATFFHFTRRGEVTEESAKMHDFDQLSHQVIGAALHVHTRLGPGLFESVYHAVLGQDLVQRGFDVESKKLITFEYGGLLFENAFQVDLIVNRVLIVEVKSVTALAPVHEKQLLTYLRLTNLQVGLLINFNVAHLKEGIKRIVNSYQRK
jgi:iron complex transport system substrate-binding protein